MHFRDEPIARMQALSLPMHWSPIWGAHFLYHSSIDNAGGNAAGIWREVRSNCARPTGSTWESGGNLAGSQGHTTVPLQPHFETEQKRALKEKKLHDHFHTPVTC